MPEKNDQHKHTTDNVVAELSRSESYAAYLGSPEPSFKHTTYFPAYDALLSKFRGKPITFVEIGVLNGGSLFMWRNFFGPAARIIGVDLNPGAKQWEQHGFEIYIGSQQDPVFWQEFCESVGQVNVVLDDGGHTYLQQIITAECLLDNIVDGGMLIIEDTHTSYMPDFGNNSINFLKYVFQWAHKINSRFGEFKPTQEDRRVFSLEIFESIVAFKVDRPKSNIVSEPTWNKPPNDGDEAQDFRKADKESLARNKTLIDQILSDAFSIHKAPNRDPS